MHALWLITKKNLKLLIRSRSSALIVVFAPLLIILILSLSYNTSTTGLNIGIHAPSFTEDVNEFITSLQEQEFKIVKYEKNIDDCIGDIKQGVMHTCITVPETFVVEGNTPKEVTFFIDPSRINLVWMIQEVIGEKFDFKSQQLSQGLTENILATLTSTRTGIDGRTSEIGSIKDKTNTASASTSAAKTSLAAIDTVLVEVSYNISVIATNISSDLSTAKNKLIDALAAVNDANITSGKTSITDAITSAQDEVEIVLGSINGTGSSTLGGVIASMEKDLGIMKDKLAAAGTAIATSTATVESATTALQESVAALDTVQAGLTEMKATIDGQKVTNAGTITTPLVTKIEKVSEEGTFLNYTFPALLILVIMFTSLLLGTTLVMMEKNSPAFFRNFFLPLRKTTFIISTYLTNLVLIVIQLVIILSISLIFLEELFAVLPMVVLILFISASVFTFLGMALGYIFTSEETGVLASISLGSLLLFLSGVVLPLESVSPLLRNITFFNPFVLSEKLVREAFIFSTPLTALWVDLLILVGYAVVLFLVILLAESFLHKQLANRFMRHHYKAHREKDHRNKNEG